MLVTIPCLLCSNLQADYPEIPICVGASNNQVNPDVYSYEDETIVVWEDERHGTNNVEIYWVSLSDPNLFNSRISQTGNQRLPAISGDVIVWQDERISTANREVYTYNLVSTEAYRLADAANQRNPDIGDRIVCEYLSGSVYNIAVWNASTSLYNLIAPSTATQMEACIDGSVVVWRDDRSGKAQVYRCDLSVTPYSAAPVYTLTNNQQHPVISGDRIAWQDVASSSQSAITVYNRAQGGIEWTYPLTGTQEAFMSISGDILVWQELRAGGSDYNIRGYDFGTGAYLDVATSTQDDQKPAISGRTVVWQRSVTDIIGAVIPAAAAIAVTTPNGGEMFLAGTDIEIAWQMTAGQAPAAVNIDFSSNNGANWTAIGTNVPFAGPFVWASPADVDSQQCLIRVQAADGAPAVDVSNAAFTIFQCDTTLTADLTGDCFVGIDDFAQFAAQWLTCGNPYDTEWCY